jgi:lysophospholipase L1-like esterase
MNTMRTRYAAQVIWLSFLPVLAALGETNLALNKPVTIDGETQGTAFPAKVVDGVPTNESGWHSGKTPSWLQVDLQETFSINRVGVYLFHDGVRRYQYAVDASPDGAGWTRVVDSSTNADVSTAAGSEHFFDPVPARFVRLTMLKNSANPGQHVNELMVFGATETAGSLDLRYDRRLLLGNKAVELRFDDSQGLEWTAGRTLALADWTEGEDRIRMAGGSAGLTPGQVRQIGFVNPSNRAPGLFQAVLRDDGELVPGDPVAPIDPPFDLSGKAVALRASLYEVPGRANLSGTGTPLKDGMVISLFGDSLTWQNVYIGLLDRALAQGEGTKGMAIRLVNHGVNGGGVLTLRDGDTAKTHFGSTSPKPFAETLVADKADVATIFIGVNDVWWRKTSPEAFEQALRDMIGAARANRTVPVLATLAIWDETAGDRKAVCDQYAEITRKVAADTGTALVDLRRAFMAYYENHGWEPQIGGSLAFKGRLLTGDGVHANDRGNAILADLIAQGIYEALKK